jgi:putative tryptophan/tyrosine transport system substrate-binding protein
MRRREFIAGLGGAAAWPFVARAADGAVRHIGVLLVGERDAEMQDRIKALEAGLRELGWIDGRNLKIDYRWSSSSGARTQAAELVAATPELILYQSSQ